MDLDRTGTLLPIIAVMVAAMSGLVLAMSGQQDPETAAAPWPPDEDMTWPPPDVVAQDPEPAGNHYCARHFNGFGGKDPVQKCFATEKEMREFLWHCAREIRGLYCAATYRGGYMTNEHGCIITNQLEDICHLLEAPRGFP